MREKLNYKKYRKVMIHCAGGELEGYINRAEDEPRTDITLGTVGNVQYLPLNK